ncbi:MAG: energy transducer TonB [Panacagrimonas sp.]
MPVSRSRTWRRRGVYLIAALLLHLALTGGLYLAEIGKADFDDRLSSPVIVELAGLREVSPPAWVSPEVDSELTSDETQALASAEEKPKLDVPVKPASAESVRPEPASVPDLVSETATTEVALASDASTDASADPAIPTDDAALAGSRNLRGSEAALTWESQVLAHLERHKRYPALALRRGQEDRVSVKIRLDRAGKVLSHSIAGSRGYAMLDQEVLALIERANPFPAPPVEIRDGDLEFMVPVEFFIDRQTVRIW